MQLSKIIWNLIFCLTSFKAFGAVKGDVRVSSAYENSDKNFIVISVQEYNEETFYNFGYETRLIWSSALGVGGLYWGTLDKGFVRIFDHSGALPADQKITLFSPTSNSHRKAKIKLELTKLGLVVTCEGGNTCLTHSEVLRTKLSLLAEQTKLKLNPIPNIRVIQHVLKFHDVNRYIIVDASRLDFHHEEVEVLFWEKGKFETSNASDMVRFRDGTKYIQLENGNMIVIPSRNNQMQAAQYLVKGAAALPLTDFGTKYISNDLIREFGLPALQRYQIASLKSTCELLTGEVSGDF